MIAVAGVPFNNDALEKDGSNVPNPTKQRRFEDCDFLDDYDDESIKAARQANSDEQDACRSLRDAVKEEYDLWLRLHEIRAVDSTTHLDPIWNGGKCTTHNSLLLQYLHGSTGLAIPASSAPSERVFSRAKLIQERQRWNLLPQRLEASIMLKHNAWLLQMH